MRSSLPLPPLLLAALLAAAAPWRGARGAQQPATPVLEHRVIAKAKVDECFAGIGREPKLFDDVAGRTCPPETEPRVNGAYVFSMVRSASTGTIWFGTRRVAARRSRKAALRPGV